MASVIERQENKGYDVTVVTPSLNQAPFIERTLSSVLAQRGVSVQYIVVDGGSRDGTREILSRYEDRLHTLIVEQDEGQADALRKGFQLAEGRICCYLNSDDYWLPDTLQRVVSYFSRHPDVDVVYGHRIYVDEEDRFLKYWILPPHFDYLMKRWDYIPQECTFWRREAMLKVGGIDPRWQFAMDYDFFVRLMDHGYRFARWNAFLGMFRQHKASKTSSLMLTVGIREVENIRERYGINTHRADWLLAILLHGSIVCCSWIYKALFGRPAKSR
jgi:glycosyltransferase involved in cell wall biosynthesis